ncbi:LysR family transcriptional regulator [Herbaspirillum sp. BH-1]|uniref:DNA-binding transcriptional LysR family regulator n=1 Tax=Herbaspirillum frisingense TaxID=92645 RepID=A0ABU1PD68_9BURK|nr:MULTISPECIES: LysR family transcriptional regulator [Herbaspirillum]MDR6583866.1 DNA-binding transcriptional LysR family regulator [Herbaspirillum frisingense]PLY58506.1 LysR family transcriptional regulator [Herbaspirillum sp. BH-1]
MDRLLAMTSFVRVVEAGSFSGAARVLGVGQPAVSKTVAQLEDKLQVKLLLRSTHGLTPTEAGLRFYERARVAIQEADEAELAARGAGAGLSGRLRISAAPTFARLFVIPHLPHFLARHPGLEVDVILDDRTIDLIAEGIDVSLRMGSLADSGVVARKLATSRRSVLASASYLKQIDAPRVPADLSAHETLVFSQLSNVWTFTREGSEVSVLVSGRVRFNAAEGIRAGVLAGIGLTIVSDWMFAPELADGSVQRLLPDWSLPEIALWAVFPTGRMASAKARAFAGFVEEIMLQQALAA